MTVTQQSALDSNVTDLTVRSVTDGSDLFYYDKIALKNTKGFSGCHLFLLFSYVRTIFVYFSMIILEKNIVTERKQIDG